MCKTKHSSKNCKQCLFIFIKLSDLVGQCPSSLIINFEQLIIQARRNREEGGRAEGLVPAIFFSQVKVPFFNNHVDTFYLAWHKVKSCFRCIPSKIMIKFACSVMWVIVYHGISWCMYVNSLVVVWSPIEKFYGSS